MKINTCCFCLSLETGGIILGGLSFGYSAYLFKNMISGLNKVEIKNLMAWDQTFKIIIIVSIVSHVINMIISTCLIIGVSKVSCKFIF